MAIQKPPYSVIGDSILAEWLRKLYDYIVFQISDHNNLNDIQGGSPDERFHLTQAQHLDITNGGFATGHKHDLYAPKTGFPVDSAGNFLITLSYNETTRTVTITPTGANFDVFVEGTKFTKTGAQSIAHGTTQGNHFIYYDISGTLVTSTTPWDLHITAPVMFVSWDATNSRGIPMIETHHAGSDPFIHQRLHEIDGTQFVSGFAISGYTLTTTGDTNTTYAIASGVIADEDLHTTCEALADGGPYAIVERVGADGHWELTRSSTVPFLRSGTTLQYNQNNAGTWQRTNVGNGNYTNYYVFAVPALPSSSITPSPGTTEGIIIVPDQATYALESQANAATVAFLNWGVMPFQEITPLYRVIMRQNAGGGGTQEIRQIDKIVGNRASFTVGATTDHGTLSGLLDDDHTQYKLRTELATARLASDATTTSTSFGDVSGLAIAIPANETWSFEVNITGGCDNTGGSRISVSVPSGATVVYTHMANGNNSNAFNAGTGNATDDPTVAAWTVAATGRLSIIRGTVVNGANAGNIQVRYKSNTAGQTTTITAGSYMVGRKH